MVSLPSALSSVDPAALLGEIVTWDLTTPEVPYDRVIAALDAAGLPANAAKELRFQTAFGRALRDFRENRTIDRLQRDGNTVSFQFTRKHLEESRLEFSYECTVYLDVETGDIACPESYEIQTHAEALFRHALAHRTTSDITRLVQTMFQRHAELYPINPRKGVAYFVPRDFRDFAAKMENFLRAMGGSLLRFPVPTGTPEGNAAAAAAVGDGLESLIKEIDSAVDEWDVKTRAGTIDKAVETWTTIRRRVEAHAYYLGDRQKALLTHLDEAKRRLAAKVAELTAAKDGGQRRLVTAGGMI